MFLKSIAVLLGLALGSLMSCGISMAQTYVAPASAATSATPRSARLNDSVTFRAQRGTVVTIKSSLPPSQPTAPPPAFANLDVNGNGSIDTSEAAAYPPLANDFGYADSSHDKRVSRTEYAHWVKQP